MTRHEARKLLGGYATGTLSEAEQQALFAAALEDQELFDELAGEQAVKEVLDQPGARQRLLAALENGTQPSGWWLRPWPWTAAAALLAIVLVVVRLSPPPAAPPVAQPVQEIARAEKTPETIQRDAAPANRAVASAPQPQPKLQKDIGQAASQTATEIAREAAPLADKAAEPLNAVAQARGGPARRDDVSEGRIAAATPAPAGAPAPAVAAFRAEKSIDAVGRFGFAYTVGADRILEIVPQAAGYLAVSAGDAVIFPSGTVASGTPVRIPIPPGAARLVIAFAVNPGIAGAPVRREETSGTVTDQDPPNGRIIVTIPATR